MTDGEEQWFFLGDEAATKDAVGRDGSGKGAGVNVDILGVVFGGEEFLGHLFLRFARSESWCWCYTQHPDFYNFCH